MTNDRPVYILIKQYIIYWPIIGKLYCMTSFCIRNYKLLLNPHKMFAKIIL